MAILNVISYLLFLLAIGYYTITSLQWFGYTLERMIFHHTKPWWNVAYLLVPFLLYTVGTWVSPYGWVVAWGYLPMLLLWYRGLDKPLVWTQRVLLFFGILMVTGVICAIASPYRAVIIPLLIAHGASALIERIRFRGFERQARLKLTRMNGLTVIGVTASYGKTSIKNIVHHLLSARYRTYATPRSVNTLAGVVKDINVDLPEDTEVYVVEMGARAEGDIAEITAFVQPQYALVGTIGPAHIAYFKTLENIRNTKLEILKSPRLREAWVHESTTIPPRDTVHRFGDDLSDVNATLEGTEFTLDGVRYRAALLGAFNATNIAAAVHVARAMGLDDATIQTQLATLKPTPHRLQRIDAGGKIILDDSFNGNIDGMMASFALCATHPGRKILITPGLVEADDALNEQVARRANAIFDRIVVTGDLNDAIFRREIDADKYRKLGDKSEMEAMLVAETHSGDLVLFANDAPSFV